MAAAAAPSSLDNILNLINLFAPKGGGTVTNSGGTTTETDTTNVSPEAAQAYINSILGGTSGLSAVASGQKSAGMYNSNTNQLLINDLLSSTAAKAAALNSSTTKTSTSGPSTSTTVPQAQISPTTGLLGAVGLGAASLLGPTIKTGVKKLGLDDLGNSISNSLFGSDSGSTASTVSDVAAPVGDFFTNFANPVPTSITGDSGINFDDLNGLGSIISNAASGIGSGISDFFGGSSSGGGGFFSFANGGRVPTKKPMNSYADGGSVDPNGNTSDSTTPSRLTVQNYRLADALPTVNDGSIGRANQQAVENARTAQFAKQLNNLISGIANPPAAPVDLTGKKDSGTATAADTSASGTGQATNWDSIMQAVNTQGQGTGVGAVDQKSTNANYLQNVNDLINQYNTATNAPPPSYTDTPALIANNNKFNSLRSQINNLLQNKPDSVNTSSIPDVSKIFPSGFNPYTTQYSSAPGTPSGPGNLYQPGNGGGNTISIPVTGGGGGSGTGGGDSLTVGPFFANGGSVLTSKQNPAGQVPGHDLNGSDNITAHLTGGEYIIPTDVVDKVGQGFFDQMLAALHTPSGN